MENERNVSPVSAHAFNNEKPPCESRVASLYPGIINCSNRAVLDGGIAMPVGTAGACRRIQLMVRLTDIDSYAIGGRRNAHCTLTVCEGEHAVRVRYRAVDRAFAAQ